LRFGYLTPFVRTPEVVEFQRWVIGTYDKRSTWERWKRANYRPENLGEPVESQSDSLAPRAGGAVDPSSPSA